jgi:sulfatase modifying factor 1
MRRRAGFTSLAGAEDSNRYPKAPTLNPQGPLDGTLKVMRGGSWLNYARDVRVSLRVRHEPFEQFPIVGFRCASDLT